MLLQAVPAHVPLSETVGVHAQVASLLLAANHACDIVVESEVEEGPDDERSARQALPLPLATLLERHHTAMPARAATDAHHMCSRLGAASAQEVKGALAVLQTGSGGQRGEGVPAGMRRRASLGAEAP